MPSQRLDRRELTRERGLVTAELVPVRRYGSSYIQITFARVMHVGSTRLYPGFLRTVAGV